MIANKIENVPDALCHSCSQLWENECRAYSSANSETEYQSRMRGGGKIACRRNKKAEVLNKPHE